MNKQINSICVMLIAIVISNLLSSCATLFTKSTTPIVLVSPPNDLKVSENGIELKVEQVFAHTKAKGTHATTIYYASGVNVSKKQKHHNLILESAGKKGEVKRRTKLNGGIVFLDVIFTGGVGCIVDGITKKWRRIKSTHVDVQAVLAGTEPRSQRKLQKIIRAQARGENVN